MDEEGFAGQVAVVTGGAGGIGAEVCRVLAAAGAQVAVADIDEVGAQRVADEIGARGGEAMAVRVALTAADVLAEDGAVVDMDIDVWDQMMAVNLRSQMLTCKHVIPHLLERGGGAIVNMSSGAASNGDLTRTAYSVSKAGIQTFTKYVATQYGRQGVRANAILPGLILTDPVREQVPPEMLAAYAKTLLTPFVGEPRDVADLVAFLVGPESRYITGQCIAIDGGMSAHTARLSGRGPA